MIVIPPAEVGVDILYIQYLSASLYGSLPTIFLARK